MIDCGLIAAGVAGAALAVAGATLQSVLRNPLAEPYMLGTVGGGSLFAAAAMHFGLTAWGAWLLPAASFLGSCVSLAIVSAVALAASRVRARRGADVHLRSSGSTVVLAGFVTGSFTGSLQMLLMSAADAETFARHSRWLFGSPSAAAPEAVVVAAVVTLATLAGLLLLSRWLDVLELGADEAACLGVNVRLTLVLALGAVSVMTATAVAVAGAIGFVGLVAPHVVRRALGPRMRWLLPGSALVGGVVLVLAEGMARRLPGDIPAGVLCALGGAPCFLALLASRHNGESRDV